MSEPERLKPITVGRRILGHGQQLASKRFGAHVKAHPAPVPREMCRPEYRREEMRVRQSIAREKIKADARAFLEADRKLTPRPRPKPSTHGIPRKRIMHRP